MHAASRHENPRLTLKLFCSFNWKITHPVADLTQPSLTSVMLTELAEPLGHSPHKRSAATERFIDLKRS